MAYDARAIANEILQRAWDQGFEPTQLDLQKIAYFLHGHYLMEHDEPLLASEFEAMPYGPVQPVLLDSFREFGNQPIRHLATRFDPVKRTRSEFPRIMDNAVIDIFDRFLPFYLQISTFDLVELTHGHDTPWSRTVENAKNAVNIGMRISNEVIRSCFEGVRAA